MKNRCECCGKRIIGLGISPYSIDGYRICMNCYDGFNLDFKGWFVNTHKWLLNNDIFY